MPVSVESVARLLLPTFVQTCHKFAGPDIGAGSDRRNPSTHERRDGVDRIRPRRCRSRRYYAQGRFGHRVAPICPHALARENGGERFVGEAARASGGEAHDPHCPKHPPPYRRSGPYTGDEKPTVKLVRLWSDEAFNHWRKRKLGRVRRRLGQKRKSAVPLAKVVVR